jgi:hypothetical protein
VKVAGGGNDWERVLPIGMSKGLEVWE